ncbi:hypothetical protein J1N35_005530 [Gossypium stocksii]|uniref:Reverse transcriptase zinc-binding domain-containing protein n=1 Tax=Gossypium stocksii TaxID=47602 RepID=A0A9D3WFZ0_9ROSI|nr:hypothetical protein J1N35_005530 [Gossypium stocksii]
MLAWDKVCLPKGMGGLGFRDVHLFNLALLGKQVWRLLTLKGTLCYQVLSSKYFPNGNLFHPKQVDKPFYTWTSIFTVAKAFENLRLDFRRDCPRCSASAKTFVHALKDCSTTWAILTLGGLDGRLHDKDYLYYIDWLKNVIRILDRKAIEDFITTPWNSWSNRNNFVFRGKKDEAQVIWDKARTLFHDF